MKTIQIINNFLLIITPIHLFLRHRQIIKINFKIMMIEVCFNKHISNNKPNRNNNNYYKNMIFNIQLYNSKKIIKLIHKIYIFLIYLNIVIN